MSSIFVQALTDSTSILTEQGQDITLTEPGESAVTVKGIVYRYDREVDPDTQAGVLEPVAVCMVPLSELETVPAEGWSVSTTGPAGETISGRVTYEVKVNRAINRVTFYVEAEE